MIRFQAIYGLCNRLRGMVGAIELAKRTNRNLELYWLPDADLPASFYDLFKNIQITKSKKIKTKLPLIFGRSQKKNLYLPKVLKILTKQEVYSEHKIHRYIENGGEVIDLAQNTRIFNFKSYLNVCYTSSGYDIFIPIESIQDQIDNLTSKFSTKTYGIHIRRSDNKESIAYSPNELFFNKIRSILKVDPFSHFYLASDDRDVKKALIAEFGDRIITNLDVVMRDSKEDIQRAVVELFTLSKTKKIYGSYWSSFSETAAFIGGIKLELLKIEKK